MQAKQEPFTILKVIIIGSSGVGKSSLLLRYTDNVYEDANYPTVGLDVKMKEVQFKDANYKLQIWDTAGQERYRTMISQQYKGVKGVLLAFDISDETSFLSVEEYLNELQNFIIQQPVMLLIGTKSDLSDQRVITAERATKYAISRQMEYIEISAKSGSGVDKVFTRLLETYTALEQQKAKPQTFKISSQIRTQQQTASSNQGCC